MESLALDANCFENLPSNFLGAPLSYFEFIFQVFFLNNKYNKSIKIMKIPLNIMKIPLKCVVYSKTFFLIYNRENKRN